jgi:hypothetical protein
LPNDSSNWPSSSGPEPLGTYPIPNLAGRMLGTGYEKLLFYPDGYARGGLAAAHDLFSCDCTNRKGGRDIHSLCIVDFRDVKGNDTGASGFGNSFGGQRGVD